MKTRRMYDPRTGTTWHLDPTGAIHDRDGNEPGAEEARIRSGFAARERASARRRERDDAMRGLGLVKVRGDRGGIYWE